MVEMWLLKFIHANGNSNSDARKFQVIHIPMAYNAVHCNSNVLNLSESIGKVDLKRLVCAFYPSTIRLTNRQHPLPHV